MTVRFPLCAILSILPLATAAAAPPAAQTPASRADEAAPWEQAKQLAESANTLFTSGRHDQAQGILEELVAKFPTHESIPEAYVMLARCRKARDNQAGADEALDLAIRKFPGSWWWFVAYNNKLSSLKAQKKNDEYVAALEAMLKACKEIPPDLSHAQIKLPIWGWRWYRYNYSSSVVVGRWLVEQLIGNGVESDILEMCDTPERAAKAVAAMGDAYKRHGKELPAEWQFAHVRLLAKAGKGVDANKALAAYHDDWGDDPRGINLWVLEGTYAQKAGDDKAADAAFDVLAKRYGKYGSMAEYLPLRLVYLGQQKRDDEFLALARSYLQRFPNGSPRDYYRYQHGRARDYVLSQLTLILGKRAAAGDDAARQEAMALWDRYTGADSYGSLQWQIELALKANKPDEAAPLVEKLLGDAYWSAATFKLLEDYAKRSPGLAKYVEDARKKYGIPAKGANSPAEALLSKLQGQIKDQQVRFMEETAAEMVKDYPNDAATIEAVKAMADYYYAKVLPAERDKWVGLMIDRYPRHPLTESVLTIRATAMRAGKQYAEAGEAMDLVEERFPAVRYGLPVGPYDTWYKNRMEYFEAARDDNGAKAYARKCFGRRADAGDVYAMEQIALYEFPLSRDPNVSSKPEGDWWMEQARKFPGTYSELQCVHNAWEAYYPRERRKPVCMSEARAAAAKLTEQTIDPEMKWAMEFAEVNLLLDKAEYKTGLDLLGKRMPAKRCRDLSLRLNMDHLGRALGEQVGDQAAAQVADKLDKVCYTQRDKTATSLLLGDALVARKSVQDGVRFYLKAIDECAWPVSMLEHSGLQRSAFQRISVALAKDTVQFAPVVDALVLKYKLVQDVAPRMLWELAKAQALRKDLPGLNQTLRKLIDLYPASNARGEVEAIVKDPDRKPKAGKAA